MTGKNRTWTSEDGAHLIVGGMIGFADGVVVIQTNDNSPPVRIPISKLSEPDAAYAKEFERRAFQAPLLSDDSVSVRADGRWSLGSKISIGLPSVAAKWKLLSKTPLTFAAVSNTGTNILLVILHPFVESRPQRVELLRSLQESNVDNLQALGIAAPQGTPIDLQAPSKLKQVSIMSGQLSSGAEVACRSMVRFDLKGCTMFQAVGTLDQTKALFEVAENFCYLNATDETIALNAGKGLDDLTAAEKESFYDFMEKTQTLLRTDDARTIIESLSAPGDLEQIVSSNQMDDVIVSFDKDKREELLSVIESFDWALADYDKNRKQISFRPPTLTRTIFSSRLR